MSGFFNFGKKRTGRIKRIWDFDAKSNIAGPALITDIDSDGRKEIIFGTKSGRLFVLNNDASIKWFYDSGTNVSETESYFLDSERSNSISSTPVASDIDSDGRKEIIFGTENGSIHALSHSGKELWSYLTKGAIRGRILLYDLFGDNKTKIIFGSGDNKLYVLDASGKVEWIFDAGSAIEGTPEIMNKDGPCIIFGCDDGTVFCVDKKGDMKWKFKTGDKVFAKPTIGRLLNDNRMFVVIGSSDNKLYVLDDAGELLWEYKTNGAIISPAVLVDFHNDKNYSIIFGSCDNNIYALNAKGDKIWSYETDFWIVSEPLIEDIDGDGKKEVIIGSYDHNVYVLDSEGSYILNYVPGLSGVVQQAGHYSDLITSEPGKMTGKKIWQFKTEGAVVGCAYIPEEKSIVVNTSSGKINELKHDRT